MRIPINPPEETVGSVSEVLRMQTDYYTRLTEETLRYLRRLQGTASPSVPGTVVMPATTDELDASGTAGTSVEMRLEVENRQRVHCIVTPMLSPLVDKSGVTWFPVAEVLPPSSLLAPAEVATLIIRVTIPTNLPPGTYHGALLMQGFREGAVSVVISVKEGKNSAAGSDEIEKAAETPSKPKKKT